MGNPRPFRHLLCLALHCGRHINSGQQIKHGQYHCICRLVYGLNSSLRLFRRRLRLRLVRVPKIGGATHTHSDSSTHKKSGKWRRNFYRRCFAGLPAISRPGQDSFQTELATKLAIVFDYVRTSRGPGVKINLILSLHKYRPALELLEFLAVCRSCPSSDTSVRRQAINPWRAGAAFEVFSIFHFPFSIPWNPAPTY